jgi:hypothetical protein
VAPTAVSRTRPGDGKSVPAGATAIASRLQARRPNSR